MRVQARWFDSRALAAGRRVEVKGKIVVARVWSLSRGRMF